MIVYFHSVVAPVIPDVPKVIRIEKKRTIVVECHVKAQSEPNIIWYKEQSIVQKSSKHTVNITKISEVCFRQLLLDNITTECDY